MSDLVEPEKRERPTCPQCGKRPLDPVLVGRDGRYICGECWTANRYADDECSVGMYLKSEERMIDDKDKISVLGGLVLQGIQTERKLRAENERPQEWKRKQMGDIITLGHQVGKLEADNAELLAALREVRGHIRDYDYELAIDTIDATIAKVSK